MTITMYQINDAGLAFIAAELVQRHKQFTDRAPTRDMLLAWAAEAERSLEAGNPAEFEIRAWDAISGHTELVRLDVACHFRLLDEDEWEDRAGAADEE